MRSTLKLGVLAFVMAAVVSAARAADDAQSVFDSIYGAKLKLAASTPSTADDVELAKSLLDSARSSASTPDLQLLMLKNAAELAAKDPAGYNTAIAAHKLEAEVKPELKPAALEAIAAIQQRRYNTVKNNDKPAAGELLLDALLDEAAAKSDDAEASQQIYRKAVTLAAAIKSPRQSQVKATAEAAQSRGRVTARIAELKAKLKANPADKASGRELVMIHFVTLDSPEQARQFTFLTDDADLTAHVTLANTDPAGLTDAQCMDMGEWYRKLADAEYLAKLPLLARAGGYYQRYLELHSTADLERTKATLALKSIKQTLDAAKVEIRPLGLAAGPSTQTTTANESVDLLKIVDPAQDSLSGTWQRDGAMLRVTTADVYQRIGIAQNADGSFEYQVRFIRHAGDGTVYVFFPVGTGRTAVVFSGHHGANGGLMFIDGKFIDNQDLQIRPSTLANGKEYKVTIRVVLRDRDADVAVELDDKPYLKWSGSQSALTMPQGYGYAIPPKFPFGFEVHTSPATFLSANLRMLTGKATPLRDSAAAGEWTDLLKGVDPARDAVKGTWSRSIAGQLSATGDAILALPGANESAYEMEASFIRTEGEEGVMFAFPAGTGRGQLFFSVEHGGVSTLAVQDHGFANTATVRPGKIENNHTYQLRVRVVPDGANVAVTIELDGKPYSKYLGPQSSLIQFPSWTLHNNKVFGFGVQVSCRLVVTAMRMRPLVADATPRSDAGGEWTDLLKLVDLDKHAFKSREHWTREANGSLTTAYGDQQAPTRELMLPLAPDGSYELQVKFTRNQGIDTPAILLPVGSAHTQFLFSAFGGQSTGFAMINGVYVTGQDDSLRVRPGKLTNGQEYTADFRVVLQDQNADITVRLDGKDYLHWQGPQSALSGRAPPDPKAIGLMSWKSSVTFSSVKVRPIGGTLRPVAEKPR